MSSAPTTMDPPITLAQLPPRCWATILQVNTGPTDLLRLMGLGICNGRRLQLLKGGDPMILQVYGTRIGLSARLARLVNVIAHAEAGRRDDAG